MTKNTHKLTAIAVTAALATGVAACGSETSSSTSQQAEAGLTGQIAGAGASSQAAAQEAWTAGFQEANPDVTVSYDPIGSGGGREQFNAGGTLFGGTDSAFKDEELAAAQKRCGGKDSFIEAPVYISPIAIVYNLDGVDALQLKPETAAKVFAGKITRWDDPAIKADNPGADLPSDRITVVHRSDDSGTTNNFTDYLHQAAGGVWTEEPDDAWPIKGQEAAEGTSGVVDAVQNGAGTIGYADASQAGDLGVAKVEVGGEYLEPSAEAAAKIFDESKAVTGQGQYVFTYELNRKPGAGTYPIVLASYAMACTQYDNAQDAKNVQGYLKHVVSPEGQQAAAGNAGSAPLPDSVRTKIEPALDAIGTGSGT